MLKSDYVDAGGLFLSEGDHTSSACQDPKTLQECKDSCTADLQCKSFAYSPSSRKCCMKKKCASESEPTKTSPWTTYYQPCSDYVDAGGLFLSEGDHTSSACQDPKTLQECKDSCTADLQCKSFAYSPSSRKCCMKKKCASESEPTKTSKWTTYYQPCDGATGTNSILSKVRFPISYNIDRENSHGCVFCV